MRNPYCRRGTGPASGHVVGREAVGTRFRALGKFFSAFAHKSASACKIRLITNGDGLDVVAKQRLKLEHWDFSAKMCALWLGLERRVFCKTSAKLDR